MSKLLGVTIALVVAALGVAIASLVFNILVFNKVNTSDDIDSTTPAPEAAACPTFEDISKEQGWKDAASRLLANIDFSADPCQDFYQFSCGKYIQNTDLAGQQRASTFDETQYKINLAIADYLDGNKLADLKSDTEKYEKNFFDICVADGLKDQSDPAVTKAKWTDLSKDLNIDLGFPLLGKAGVPKDFPTLFSQMGLMERLFTGGPFMTSFVTADFKDSKKHALYINQPSLHLTRDYFVKPQFINKLQDYAVQIRDLIIAYKKNMGLTMDHKFCKDDANKLSDEDCAQQIAEWAVNIERSLAMASWPGTELRNYKQQYTPFDDLTSLDQHFGHLSLGTYVRGLLQMNKDAKLTFKVVLSEPTYFAALDGMFESGHISLDEYTNYLAIHFLLDNSSEYGIDIPSADGTRQRVLANSDKEKKFEKYITRRGFGARGISRRPLNPRGLAKDVNDEVRTGCVDSMIDYMPFGPGYTYVKNREDRDAVRADAKVQTENIIKQFNGMLDTLTWIDKESLARAHAKSDGLVRNYLWPDSVFGKDFSNPATVDAYHTRYSILANTAGMTFWDAIKQMKAALMATEQWDIVDKANDRSNFLSSPATVNAWYQPERNSITLPFGILNPPFYDLTYPQAYSYGGEGGVAGHELTHGYDDEGTQFDENGELASCEFTHCSILDNPSRTGFGDMAQCVVQQFNSQCCPLKKGNVRCVNGETTQGENIADIGGLQAAYRAYNQYIADNGKTELRLPGLEQFTLDQIFWLTYGGTWCMKITDDRLARQLMTDVHSPSSCRVNQVMQDIPQFAQDFKCKRGVSAMYPVEDDRCDVWVGF